MYAYLDFNRSARLRIFPGDTLGQPRHLYGEPQRVRRLFDLDSWDAKPNFHFGYREPGVCWIASNWDVERYVDYRIENIHKTHELPTSEMRGELKLLVGMGMFDSAALGQYDRELGRRPRAAPRPGLWLECCLPGDLSASALAERVGASLRAALVALDEPLDALEPA